MGVFGMYKYFCLKVFHAASFVNGFFAYAICCYNEDEGLFEGFYICFVSSDSKATPTHLSKRLSAHTSYYLTPLLYAQLAEPCPVT